MNPAVFPVRPREGKSVTFGDTFGAPRSGGRTHKGTDIYAEAGSDVLAVEDGYAQPITGALTGLGIALTSRDGSRYVYAHLDDYVGRFPRQVRAGEKIGTVGTTGNAKGGRAHLHFEAIPPRTETRVNPFPLLRSLQVANSLPMVHVPKSVPSQAPKKPNAPKPKQRSGGLAVPLVLLAIASAAKKGKL